MRVTQLFLAFAAALVIAAAASAGNVRISAGASAGSLLGNSIGVDFRAGTLVAAWADNSTELGGNPDPPALDIAFGSTSAAPINVTRQPLSQFGVSLAVNPTDPDNLVLVANTGAEEPTPGAVRATSRDGGATWSVAGGLPGNFGAFSPQVAFDAFGNCFLAVVHDPTFGDPRVELLLSTDGGGTFAPVAVPNPPGLETNVSLAAGFGAVWLAFQSYEGSVSIKALAAPVAGRGSVGAFAVIALPGSADGQTPDIAIGPGGRALVVYHRGQFTSAPTVQAQLDADGLGPAGFGASVTVANVAGYPHFPRPAVAYDTTGGRAYVVYSERQEATGPEDVLLNFSDDDGADWSPAIRVNDAVHSPDRRVPNVAVAGGGAVGVAWYDFRSGGAELWGDVRDAVQRPPEPRAPQNLAATAVSQSQIDLRWSDVSDDETAFQIERRSANPSEPPAIVATLPASSTSWSDTGLPADTPFGYRVRAVNGVGPSLWSNGAGATTLAFPPSAPQGLTATAITFQRIDLAWQPVDGADSYEVQQSTDGTSFVTVRRPIVTEIMLFELQSSTTYFFRVRAVNSGGSSPWSSVASATTLGESQPSAPSGLSAVALSATKILLEWRDNSVNETKFEIERSSGGAFARAGTAGANAHRFTDSGLRRSTSYTYRVRACNGALCSPYSNTASATTPRR
jgi:hypothetical protein